MQPRPSKDSVLRTALFLGFVSWAVACWGALTLILSVEFRTGLIKLHIFEPDPPPTMPEQLTFYGGIALSLLVGFLVASGVFRLTMRFGQSHPR